MINNKTLQQALIINKITSMTTLNYTKKDEDIEHLTLLVTKLLNAPKTNGYQVNQIQNLTNLRLQNSQKMNEKSLKMIKQLCKLQIIKEQEKKALKEQNQLLRQQKSIFQSQKRMYLQKIKKYQEGQQSKLKNVQYVQELSPSLSTPIAKVVHKQSAIRNHSHQYDHLESFYDNINGPIGGSPTKDQMYRLNSYLIEYNTNIKLLLEKYNYTLKVRGMGIQDQTHQLQLLKNTELIIKNRRVIEESRIILKNSRREYFQSDQSSDIQEEHNNIAL